MKRSEGTFCDSPACPTPDVPIHPKAPDHLNYGKTDYHAACYLARRKKPLVIIDEFRAVFAILALMFLIAAFVPTEADADEGDVRGCIATYYGQSGKYTFEPFLKVADKTSPAEDGTPEVWGFRPWNLEPPDKEGKTHPVNVRDDQFIPLNVFKQVGPRKVKCPEGMW